MTTPSSLSGFRVDACPASRHGIAGNKETRHDRPEDDVTSTKREIGLDANRVLLSSSPSTHLPSQNVVDPLPLRRTERHRVTAPRPHVQNTVRFRNAA